jgi:hypothetical protein
MDFYSAISLKQLSADRHVAPLGHIILIPSQPVFAGRYTQFFSFIIISGVMVSVLTLSAVYHGFEPKASQTKD